MKVSWRRLAVGYLLLLGSSHAVRAARPRAELELGPEERLLVASAVTIEDEGALPADRPDAGQRQGVSRDRETGVRLVYRSLPEGEQEASALPVLVLHGSPGSGKDVLSYAKALARERRVILPDLPGFGRSQGAVPNLSVVAHADYALQLLEHLGLERVHVVGFSMGGGVGLSLYERAPARVASLTLLSAIGVVELELFGSQERNHMVHGVQRALVLLALEGLPHFGALDDAILSHAYARNFHETDQEPLRGILERLQAPLLIQHGREDVLVPYAAAREHERIVPHSELLAYDEGHFLVFQRPDALARDTSAFLDRVETGRAPGREQAEPARVTAAVRPFDAADVPPLAGVALLVFFLATVLATFVSEDLVCLGVGALVAQGRVGFLPGTAACLVGIVIGDVLLFWLGRSVGRRAFARPPGSWFLSEERIVASSHWFARRGPIVILTSRLLPGTRLPTYVAAGVLRTSFWWFLLWFLAAALLWTPLVVWLAARFGEGLTERLEAFQDNAWPVLLATVFVGWLVLRLLVPLVTRRGRRLLAIRMRRKLRFEFWPPWLVYAPVVAHLLWWTLKARGRLLFTAANPAMPHAGVAGESKGEILAHLARANPSHVPPTVRVDVAPAEVRLAGVDAFLEEHGLELPVVLKPDVGERGSGVRVCRTRAELREALEHSEDVIKKHTPAQALLAQAFVPGEEFGLFYARHPDEPHGRLLSITEKHLPFVTGDGERTLEALILEDERAAFTAHAHLLRFAARLDEVPAAGARVALGDLGTHCRGATFLDGAEHWTPELEAALERVSRGYEGFFFGRYDVRSASTAELRAGSFRILELNGVTSEMTHVYDPRHGARHGWRTLIEQWRLAFEIGRANAERGAPVSGLRDLLGAVLEARRKG